MSWLKKSARFGRAAALAAAGAALPVLFAGPLFAGTAAAGSTGDWGWGATSETAPAGSTFVTGATFPRLPCHSETCTYEEPMLFEARGMNGTTITTPVGTTTDFVNGGTGEVIGTCTVDSTVSYDCRVTSSGSVTGGSEDDVAHSIHGSGNLEFAIPADQEQGSVAIHYSWNNPFAQGEPNDTFDVLVSDEDPVPFVNPWVAGGGSGVLALGAAGFVLYRRRQTTTPGLPA